MYWTVLLLEKKKLIILLRDWFHRPSQRNVQILLILRIWIPELSMRTFLRNTTPKRRSCFWILSLLQAVCFPSFFTLMIFFAWFQLINFFLWFVFVSFPNYHGYILLISFFMIFQLFPGLQRFQKCLLQSFSSLSIKYLELRIFCWIVILLYQWKKSKRYIIFWFSSPTPPWLFET